LEHFSRFSVHAIIHDEQERIDMMQCPVCGTQNDAEAAFCYKCGSALTSGPATGPTVRLAGTESDQGYDAGSQGTGVPPYQQPFGGYAVPQQSNSALIAMILGIVAFMGPSLLTAIPAIIIGMRARDEIQASRGQLTGEGLAQAGIILGWINIALSVIAFCAFCGPLAVLSGL
jgi:hypothetical protein